MAALITLHGTDEYLDLTRFIPVPEYNVNELTNSVEWKDGNRNIHRRITDRKIQGSFRLKFPTRDAYIAFVEFLSRNRDELDDSILCTVYSMNKNSTKAIHAFLDFEPQNELPLIGKKSYDGFEVEISERGDF